MGALLLAAGGGIVLLSTQLDRDAQRLVELEGAVRQMAEELGRLTDELEDRKPRPAGRKRSVA